jgi:hypothetical protein
LADAGLSSTPSFRPLNNYNKGRSKRSSLSNLPERNAFFTGREEVLARIQEALAEHGRMALSGLGGIGKTQTAVQYAHRHFDEYVYTHSREAIASGYVKIAGLLKLPEADSQDQTEAKIRKACLL